MHSRAIQMCIRDSGEHLGRAGGVGGGTGGEVLGDGHAGGVAIDGCGRAEHEVVAVVMAHHVQNDQRSVEVVVIVFNGLGNTLAHGLVAVSYTHLFHGIFWCDGRDSNPRPTDS